MVNWMTEILGIERVGGVEKQLEFKFAEEMDRKVVKELVEEKMWSEVSNEEV